MPSPGGRLAAAVVLVPLALGRVAGALPPGSARAVRAVLRAAWPLVGHAIALVLAVHVTVVVTGWSALVAAVWVIVLLTVPLTRITESRARRRGGTALLPERR